MAHVKAILSRIQKAGQPHMEVARLCYLGLQSLAYEIRKICKEL